MKEKLIIRNFGPIKDVELELGRFNILIGEQATGKSTVAKVLAVCRYFTYILKIHPWEELFTSGLLDWGLFDFIIPKETYISYRCEHYFFEAKSINIEEPISYKNNDINFGIVLTSGSIVVNLVPISNSFKKLLEAVPNVKPKDGTEYDNISSEFGIPTSFYQNEVASVLDNPFYFPVERGLQSIFSLGRSSVQNISDTLFNQFAKLDQSARFFKTETAIEPLNIIYKNENGQGLIKSDKHDFVKVFSAASGYQSTIPVVLTIKYYNKTKKKGKTFIIEEPELNLFPNAQQKLMEYLVEQVTSFNNSFLITTHSPYILTSLNNMMYAWQVGQEKRKQVIKVMEEKYWLNPNEVKAYRLLSNGTCESLIADDKLLMPEKIDEVSGIINKEFDKIFSIQYQEQEVEA